MRIPTGCCVPLMTTKTHKARASRTIAEDERLLWERVAATVRPFHLACSLNRSGDAKVIPEQFSEGPPKSLLGFKKSVVDKSRDIFRSSQPLPQNRVLPLMDSKDRKKIERGFVKIEARLDLHGLGSARAHALLLQFISHAAMSGKKYVLIITGKGNSFKNGYGKNGASGQRKSRQGETVRQGGVLRQSVPLWLETAPFRPYVSAVEEAARHHGGEGALYVRLRHQKGVQKGALLR